MTMKPLTFSSHGPAGNGKVHPSPLGRWYQKKYSSIFCVAALVIGAGVVQHQTQCSENARVIATNISTCDSNVSSNSITRISSRAYKTGKSPRYIQDLAHETDPGGDDFEWPRVAWVMSFPNSGTSFTMRLVQRMSNITGASNYGMECDVDAMGNNYPVYDRSREGPFYSQLTKRRIPTRYVPTKTHCGGYTTNSGPERYIHTSRSFMMQCLTGNRLTPEFDEDGSIIQARGKALYQVEKHHTHYDPSLVQRAVHVVRDPFDNIVSRFHLEQNVHTKKKDTKWLERFPSDPKGFQAWCKAMDSKVEKEEKNSRFIDDALFKAFDGVPCHSEFYRYTQWHSLALAATLKMRLPALILHYERFEDDFDNMYEELFSFLELPQDGQMTEFVTGKKYSDYFDSRQRRRAMALVKTLSDPETWNILQRYDKYSYK